MPWLAGGAALVIALGVGVVLLLGDGGVETGRADAGEVFDPVEAGEALPDGYRPLLDRDQIQPVYDPAFTSPDLVDWPGDSLVLGVAGVNAAKAYPVTHLNQHEMVIDDLEGTPILVSW